MQAEKVFNQDLYFKKTVKFVGEPMSHLESIASSAVFRYCCSLYLFNYIFEHTAFYLNNGYSMSIFLFAVVMMANTYYFVKMEFI